MLTSDPDIFSYSLLEGGSLLGLDVGRKNIGTACCDKEWCIATPARLIRRQQFTADLAQLVKLCETRAIIGLVLGLPLNMDGSDSPQTQSLRAFARNLSPLDRPILLWDERWSTSAVTRAMIAADMSRKKRAAKIDNAAAAFILQGALDRMRGATHATMA